jgi:hypothetical protein
MSQGENAARSLGKSLHSRQGNSSFLTTWPRQETPAADRYEKNPEEADADQSLMLFFKY